MPYTALYAGKPHSGYPWIVSIRGGGGQVAAEGYTRRHVWCLTFDLRVMQMELGPWSVSVARWTRIMQGQAAVVHAHMHDKCIQIESPSFWTVAAAGVKKHSQPVQPAQSQSLGQRLTRAPSTINSVSPNSK